jgi:hypothetical protein
MRTKIQTMLLGVAALAMLSVMADSAWARAHHHEHHHSGYAAFARGGSAPSGPSSLRFQNGSGWNNGRLDKRQYGRPGHW